MNKRLIAVATAFLLILTPQFVSAQVDSVLGQVTAQPTSSFAGGVSGNGRIIVFESRGNHATINPRNEDGNNEIFLFDYAQRRIFQITDTSLARNDPNDSCSPSIRGGGS